MVVEGGGSLPAEALAWSVVERGSNGLDLLRCPSGQVSGLREVPAKEAVRVLVGASLPRAVRVGEADRNAGLDREPDMCRQLLAAVPLHRPLTQLPATGPGAQRHRFGQRPHRSAPVQPRHRPDVQARSLRVWLLAPGPGPRPGSVGRRPRTRCLRPRTGLEGAGAHVDRPFYVDLPSGCAGSRTADSTAVHFDTGPVASHGRSRRRRTCRQRPLCDERHNCLAMSMVALIFPPQSWQFGHDPKDRSEEELRLICTPTENRGARGKPLTMVSARQ